MDAWLKDACSSYRDGFICKDGFVQVANCRAPKVCDCGTAYRGETPPCMRDSFTPTHFNDDGSPRYYPRQKEGNA